MCARVSACHCFTHTHTHTHTRFAWNVRWIAQRWPKRRRNWSSSRQNSALHFAGAVDTPRSCDSVPVYPSLFVSFSFSFSFFPFSVSLYLFFSVCGSAEHVKDGLEELRRHEMAEHGEATQLTLADHMSHTTLAQRANLKPDTMPS